MGRRNQGVRKEVTRLARGGPYARRGRALLIHQPRSLLIYSIERQRPAAMSSGKRRLLCAGASDAPVSLPAAGGNLCKRWSIARHHGTDLVTLIVVKDASGARYYSFWSSRTLGCCVRTPSHGH